MNEFGVLEVITDEADDDSVKKAHATTTWAVPTAQEGKSTQLLLLHHTKELLEIKCVFFLSTLATLADVLHT